MKQCIITGGGSKFGAMLTNEFLANGYYVHLVTSNGNAWHQREHVNVIDVNWQELDISKLRYMIPDVTQIDAVLFNHNASALDITKFSNTKLQSPQHWQQSYFVACQFPYYFVKALSKKLSADSKIAWMLSELIKYPVVDQVGFADYIGNKFTNACIMKSFSQELPSCFFGLHPDGGVDTDSTLKAANIIKIFDTVATSELNGNIFDSQGNKLVFF